MYVYILRLENDKWYIGTTSDLQKRMDMHIKGYGPPWTKVNKPLHFESVCIGDIGVERAFTILYARKYGIDSVRGHCMTSLKLSDKQRKAFITYISKPLF